MNTFGKAHRLLKKSEYDHVFAQAMKLVTAEFIVLYRENTLGHARLGLALSKKMINKAHDRNRIKRMLRETFRTRSYLPSVDIIVLARPGVGRVQNPIIIGHLEKAWSKLIAISKNGVLQ